MAAHERIVVFETLDERELVFREAAGEVEVWRGCGAERGTYEDEVSAAAVAEYIPPGRARAA